MLDTILDAVKGEVGNTLKEKTGFNAEQVSKTWDVTEETISQTLENPGSGGLNGVLNLFSKKDNDAAGNGILDSLGSNLVNNLISKLGIDGAMANTIKSIIVPVIVSKLTDKVDGDSGMLSSLLGSSGGLGDKVTGALGGLFN